jgi:hypothetical protein
MTAHNWTNPGDSVSVWPIDVIPFDRSERAGAMQALVDEDDRLLSEFSPPESPIRVTTVPVSLPRPIEDPVRAYEAEALSALHGVLAVVRQREKGEKQAQVQKRPPSGAALASALAEVKRRTEDREFAPETAAHHRNRLLVLDDAARRLDVLLPLHANGAISIRELRDRTDALCSELNNALFSGSS